MKKVLVLTVLFAAGAALLAETRSVVHDGYRYTFNLNPDGSDCWDNPITAVSLDSILPADPRCAPSNSFKESTVIDLCAVEKIIEASIDCKSEGIPPVRLVEFADGLIENVWNPDLVTEVNLPGALRDIDQFLNDYCSPGDYAYEAFFPKLCSVNILGDGEFASSDGAVYTSDLKELWFCPYAKTSLKIPPACTTIGDDAFWYCHGLETITGGEGLLYVGTDAFGPTSDDACESEPSPADYDDEENAIPFVRKFQPGTFMMLGNMVFGYRGRSVPQRLVLPKGIRAIADNAFSDDKFAGVKIVDDNDVDPKTGRRDSRLRWVGSNAVDNDNLEEPGILGGVIVDFRNRTLAEKADPAAWTDRTIVAITPYAYSGNPHVTGITIPASVEEIGDSCFAECYNLASVTFRGTPQRLGDFVFNHCLNLKSVRFETATLPPAETSNGFYNCTPEDLVTYVPGAAVNWPVVTVDGQDMWKNRALSRSIRVIAQEGVYGKWTLAQLGVTVPKAGTVFTPKAYGLPSGLVLKSNAAVRNKKKVIITRAKTSWWIEGAPLESLDYETRPAYIVVTLNGKAVWQPLQFEVRPMEPVVVNPELVVNTQAADFALDGVGKGWSVSGLPPGLKFTAVAIKASTLKTKIGRITRTTRLPAHKAYRVYGTPTQAGTFTVTAKKKMSNGYYSLKKFEIRVQTELGIVPFAKPEILSGFSGGSEIQKATLGLTDQLRDVVVSAGTTLSASGLPKGMSLVLRDGRYVFEGVPAAGGTYYVTLTAMKNGMKVVRRMPVRFTGMPSWLVGTYNGDVEFSDEDGNESHALTTISITSLGKVTGKFLYRGNTFNFSRTGLSRDPVHGRYYVKDVVAGYVPVNSKGKPLTSKTQTRPIGTLYISNTPCGAVIDAHYVSNPDDESTGDAVWVTAKKNLWATDYKSIGSVLSKISPATTIADPKHSTWKLKIGLSSSGTVKAVLTVQNTGCYEMVNNGKTSKRQLVPYKASCATVLLPETTPQEGVGPFCGYAYLVFPPETKKLGRGTYRFPGCYRRIELPRLQSDSSALWSTGEFRTQAEAALPSASGGSTWYKGLFSLKVSQYNADSKRYFGTFKPEGCAPIEIKGTFKKSTEGGAAGVAGGSVTIYTSRVRLPFPNGGSIIVNLVLRPFGQIGCLEAYSQINADSQLGADYQNCYFTTLGYAYQNIWIRPETGLEFTQPSIMAHSVKVKDFPASLGKTLTCEFEDDGRCRLTLVSCKDGQDMSTTYFSAIENVTVQRIPTPVADDEAYEFNGYIYFEHEGAFHQIGVSFSSDGGAYVDEVDLIYYGAY